MGTADGRETIVTEILAPWSLSGKAAGAPFSCGKYYETIVTSGQQWPPVTIVS